MKKFLTTALAAATLIAGAVVATSNPAEARNRGGAVAAGIIGGIAAGALIAGAANARPYNAPGYYGYAPAPGPVYYGRPVYQGPRCVWERQRVWDGYAWRMRRVQVCY